MRERCAGRGCEHARSAHDPGTGACGWCLDSGRCRGWASRRRHLWRELVVDGWRCAYDAREALRESGRTAPASVAGTAGALVAYYQLSTEEFAEVHPCPRLGDFMRALSPGYRWS